MMILRLQLMICIISTLWTSAFGTIYTVKGGRTHKLEMCGGDANDIKTYIIRGQKINKLPYDFFNENIIVRANGHFEVGSPIVDPLVTKVLILNKYIETPNSKNYEGELRLGEWNVFEHHISNIGVKLTIPRVGLPKIQNYLYAGAWYARFCPHAISSIQTLKIVN